MEKCQPVLTVLLHHLHQPIRRFLWVVTRGFSFPEQKMRHSKVHGIVYNYSGEAVKASIIINLSAYFPSFFLLLLLLVEGKLRIVIRRTNPLWSSANIYFYSSCVCTPFCQKKNCRFFPWSNFFVPVLRWIRSTEIFFLVCWITFEEITGIGIRIFSAWF